MTELTELAPTETAGHPAVESYPGVPQTDGTGPRPDAPEAIAERTTGRTLTMAHGLLFLVAVMAAVMRFSTLAAAPLSLAEAGQALLVWQFWHPAGLSTTNELLGAFLNTGSPAYFSFTSPLMLILGSSDAVMRLVPALFGLATVLLPWLLRGKLGEAGALVVAFLLAVSPLMASVSRTVGGDAIALFAIFLFVAAWIRYGEAGRVQWLYTLMAALGLGLCSSSLFYTGLVTFALALLVHRRFGPGLLAPLPRPDRPTLRNSLIFGGVFFLCTATFCLFNLAGLGATFAILGDWFSAFSLQGTVLDWLEPIFLILRYEPALLILGLISLAWATWNGSPFPGLLSYWFTAALFLAILLHHDPVQVLVLVLAGYLLAGCWCNSLLAAGAAEEPDPTLPVSPAVLRWGLFAVLLAAGAIFYFNLSRHLREVVFSPDDISNLLLAIFAILVAVASVNFVRVLSRPAAAQGTILALLVLFGIYSWGTAWWLTHEGASDPRERWIAATTDPGVRLMQEILAETSFQLDNAVDSLELAVAVDNPVLRWYLREFDNARFGDTIPATTTAEALITPATFGAPGQSEGTLNLGVDYFGADFGLFRYPPLESNVQCGLKEDGTERSNFICTVEQVLRWWLFHDAPGQSVPENIILWIRTDLTLEGQ